MTDIQSLINQERISLTNFNNIDNYNIDIKKTYFRYLINLPIQEVDKIVVNLVSTYQNELRHLRFGDIIPNITNSLTESIPSPESIKNERWEFGGYINGTECNLNSKGKNGMIKDFILTPRNINFHTHPPYNGRWPFAPPSEVDISSLIEKQREYTERIYNAVATAEGIYIYYYIMILI